MRACCMELQSSNASAACRLPNGLLTCHRPGLPTPLVLALLPFFASPGRRAAAACRHSQPCGCAVLCLAASSLDKFSFMLGNFLTMHHRLENLLDTTDRKSVV